MDLKLVGESILGCLIAFLFLPVYPSSGVLFGGIAALGIVLGVYRALRHSVRMDETRSHVIKSHQHVFFVSYWAALAVLSGIWSLRWLLGVELNLFGTEHDDVKFVESVAECAKGLVDADPKCLEAGFPHGYFLVNKAALYVHVIGAAIAMFCAPFQLSPSFQRIHDVAHRRMGRCYVLAVFASGCAGAVLAVHSMVGLVSAIGHLSLAAAWLVTLFVAVLRVRQAVSYGAENNAEAHAVYVQSHRRWMLRNWCLTLAGPTRWMWLSIFGVFPLGLQGEVVVLNVVAWIAWIPNALLVEIYIRKVLPPFSVSRPTSRLSGGSSLRLEKV